MPQIQKLHINIHTKKNDNFTCNKMYEWMWNLIPNAVIIQSLANIVFVFMLISFAVYFNKTLVGCGLEWRFRCTSSIVSFIQSLISLIDFNMNIGTSSSRRWKSISPSKSRILCFRALNSKPTSLLLMRA